MICIIALIVFGILGIFSAAQRRIAKEAWDCVFRRITFRPCTTGLDQRLKAKIVARTLRFPSLGRVVYRHFEMLSWLFLIILIGSVFFSLQGIYNYAVYGNCNGEQGGFCIFDPQGDQRGALIEKGRKAGLTNPGIDDDPSFGPENASVTIIEFGGFTCPYTRKAEKALWRVLDEYKDDVRFVYRDFPLSAEQRRAKAPPEAADCVLEQSEDAFWEYRRILFENQDAQTERDLFAYTKNIPINRTQWKMCFDSGKYSDEVQHDYEQGLESKIYGTPTFFINNRVLVGPARYQTFRNVIEQELKASKER